MCLYNSNMLPTTSLAFYQHIEKYGSYSPSGVAKVFGNNIPSKENEAQFAEGMVKAYSKSDLWKLFRDFARLRKYFVAIKGISGQSIAAYIWSVFLFHPYTCVQDYFRLEGLDPATGRVAFVLRCKSHMLLWDLMRVSPTSDDCRLCILDRRRCGLRVVSWDDSPIGKVNLVVSAILDLHTREIVFVDDHGVLGRWTSEPIPIRVQNGPEIQDLHIKNILLEKYPNTVRFERACSLSSVLATIPLGVRSNFVYENPALRTCLSVRYMVIYQNFDCAKLIRQCQQKTLTRLTPDVVVSITGYYRADVEFPWEPTEKDALARAVARTSTRARNLLHNFFVMKVCVPPTQSESWDMVHEMAVARIEQIHFSHLSALNLGRPFCEAREQEVRTIRLWARALTSINPNVAIYGLESEAPTPVHLAHFFACFPGLRKQIILILILYRIGYKSLNSISN